MKERELTAEEKAFINSIGEKYGVKFDLTGKKIFAPVGCKKCNDVGYYGRIGLFEILIFDEKIRELISQGESTLKVKEQALQGDYKPLIVDGINKVLNGVTDLDELNRKLRIY